MKAFALEPIEKASSRELKAPGLSPHYVLEISRDGPLDHLTVVVEGDPTATAGLQQRPK